MPSSPDLKLTMSWNCSASSSRCGPGRDQPRVEVACARAHRQSAAGVRPMLVSIGLPSLTAARLAPFPRCPRMTRPLRAADLPVSQLFHQEMNDSRGTHTSLHP